MSGQTGRTNRIVGYDLLRIIAALSVVLLHSAAQFWYTLPVDSPDWLVANSYDAVSRFGVPIFVMLSGALFLGDEREVDLKRLYTHNILRLAVVYVVWSVLYGLFDCRDYELAALHHDDIFREIAAGRYHLWFLPMLIGIYMVLPILKGWLKNAEKRQIEYILLLFVIFQIGRETFMALRQTDLTNFGWGIFTPDMVCGYVGYFILGYYLTRYELPAKYKRMLYISAPVGEVLNIILGNVISLRAGAPTASIYDSFGLFTFLIVTALFVAFTGSRREYSEGFSKIAKELSLATFGIYLMHIGVIEFLEPFGIHSMMIAPIVCVPLFALAVFIVCAVIAALLRRIPKVGKYLC